MWMFITNKEPLLVGALLVGDEKDRKALPVIYPFLFIVSMTVCLFQILSLHLPNIPSLNLCTFFGV